MLYLCHVILCGMGHYVTHYKMSHLILLALLLSNQIKFMLHQRLDRLGLVLLPDLPLVMRKLTLYCGAILRIFAYVLIITWFVTVQKTWSQVPAAKFPHCIVG